jgi:hypothetical protein
MQMNDAHPKTKWRRCAVRVSLSSWNFKPIGSELRQEFPKVTPVGMSILTLSGENAGLTI